MIYNQDIQGILKWLNENVGPRTRQELFYTYGKGWCVKPVPIGIGTFSRPHMWMVIIEDKQLAMQATLMFSDIAKIENQSI